jgi:hypothetical protein
MLRDLEGELREPLQLLENPAVNSINKGHSTLLFDHLVGAGEWHWRDIEAERLGGLQIDDQIESCWSLYGQFAYLGAPEDAIDVEQSGPSNIGAKPLPQCYLPQARGTSRPL